MGITLTTTLHLTNPLTHSADVLAVQHLLTAKGFPVVADGWFGAETAAACIAAKKRLRFVVADQVGSAGPHLVKALEDHAPFPPPPIPAARIRYVAQLHKFLAEASNWDWAMVRPIPHKGHTGRVRTDCSGSVTYAAELADCPDPNGRLGGKAFSGYGFTGSILNHCEHLTFDMLKPADLVVFGGGTGHHVVAVLAIDDDPVCFSHGRQGNPRQVGLMEEQAAQAVHGNGHTTFLRFLP